MRASVAWSSLSASWLKDKKRTALCSAGVRVVHDGARVDDDDVADDGVRAHDEDCVVVEVVREEPERELRHPDRFALGRACLSVQQTRPLVDGCVDGQLVLLRPVKTSALDAFWPGSEAWFVAIVIADS